jgi:hypothetical protein
MPTRYLFEKICVSQTLASLTADEERFFYRLLVKCDDFGRYYAQPSLLRAACFPLMLEQVSDAVVEAWRDRLDQAGLIDVYESGGLLYLVVTTWDSYQRRRATTSKFPNPPHDDTCPQPADMRTRIPPVSGIRNPVFVVRDSGGDAHPREAAAPPPPAPPPANGSHPGTNGLIVPASLTGFHAVMIGTQGYEPSPALFEQITERYGSLDLREEALKLRDWLADTSRNRRQRRATTTFVLKWLRKALDDLPPGEHQTPGPDASYGTAAPEGDPLPELAAEPAEPSPTAAEAERIWSAALAELGLGMSQANVESYLAGTEGASFADDELTVQVGNPLVREALEQRFRQHILRALYDVVGRPCRVRLVPGRPRPANGAESFGHRSMQPRES